MNAKRITRKEQMEQLREKLKDNPKALAELDMMEFRDASEWWRGKLEKEAGKVARINRHFLR